MKDELEILQEIIDHENVAKIAARNGQYAFAARTYEKTMELAPPVSENYDPNDDLELSWLLFYLRKNQAGFLTLAERNREALAALAPATQLEKKVAKPCCLYQSLLSQIEIAQNLPTSLAVIEKSYRQAEDYYKSSGYSNWQSLTLALRSNLHLNRGNYQEAFNAAQEGLNLSRDECPKFSKSFYFHCLYKISVAMKDAEQARRYADEWEQHQDESDYLPEATLHIMKSETARLEGNISEALDAARSAAQMSETADWVDTRFKANSVLVRTLLLVSETEHARDVLRKMVKARKSENGHHRYAFHLLRGDYYLARARSEAGIPPLDDEFYIASEQEKQPQIKTDSRCLQEIKKALIAYDAALKEGSFIDNKLNCSVRMREISERKNRIAN